MDYFFYYNKLISNAKNLKRCKKDGNYYERHHIIPSCMGGLDTPDNLVLLTAREHYISHLLLHKIYPDDFGLLSATVLMSGRGKYTNRQYAIFREKYSDIRKELMSGENNPFLGKILSEETKKKIGLANKNKVRSEEYKLYCSERQLGQKHSEETKNKMSLSRKELWNDIEFKRKNSPTSETGIKARNTRRKNNYTPSKETRNKLSKSLTGRNITWGDKISIANKGKASKFKGVPRSEETKKKISNSRKNVVKSKCKYCKNEFSPAMLSRWHNDNCKQRN